ncbi:hypothetical protein GCM10009574_066330 [Streptomyces asiaticus]|uniref:Transposase n=2 Tax=Streptomyces rhizosphaericus TaxID=114699 RepID=A0ABN1PE94_9ACTN
MLGMPWSEACIGTAVVGLSGARMYIFVVIEHSSRRIRILGATARPTTSWVTQAAKLSHLGIRRHDRLGGILHAYKHAA